MISRIIPPLKLTALICGLWLLSNVTTSLAGMVEMISDSEIAALDARFQDYYANFQQANSKADQKLTPPPPRFKQLSKFEHALQTLNHNGQHSDARALITRNLELIKDNIDTPTTHAVVTQLLAQNALTPALELLQQAENESNKVILSNIRYAFAHYYLTQRAWHKTLQHLDGIIADLVSEDAHYALLIKGVALQQLKRHREAISIYEKIPNTSTYYSYAILNKATAYIRQDWWSDAHIVIREILQQQKGTISTEMENRLYVVLGYSLLRKEYFRDARDIFRKVSLESQYTNRALLGIALAAINQNDHVGALNVINILQEKAEYDLPSEESHLLLAYIYSELEQHLTASGSYNQAIAHYTQRIQNIETLLGSADLLNRDVATLDDDYLLHIGGYVLNLMDHYPASFLHNYVALREHKQHLNTQKAPAEFDKLYRDYQATLNRIVHDLLSQKISHLNSYIDQSRYGLARVYDNSLLE